MKISYRVTNTDRLAMQLKADGRKRLAVLARDVQEALERYTPVRSGQAKRSWRTVGSGDRYEISNTQPYTVFLEQGSSRQRPRGITRPAIQELKTRRKLT